MICIFVSQIIRKEISKIIFVKKIVIADSYQMNRLLLPPLFLFLFLQLISFSIYAQKKYNSNEETNYSFEEGKTIRRVKIKILNVSGPALDGNKDYNINWFGNIANSLHYKTREWVIREKLLFKEGGKLNSGELAESERLLRTSNLFLDARIKVLPVENSTDKVDIEVITKDRWTLTYLASYNADEKNGYLGLRDDNLLGLGHRMDAALTHDQDETIGWGGIVKYYASNVRGSYIDVSGKIEANKKYDIQSVSINRPFITIETNWAGGLELLWENNYLEFIDEQKKLTSIPFSTNKQDIWVGRSFPINFGPPALRNKSRIIVSGGITRESHPERPEVSPFSNRIFENSTINLLNFGIINRRYYKDKYIDGFGITEDIPVGGILSMTGGYEDRELSNRWYSGMELIYSRRFERTGYFSGRFGTGGFRNINRWEQNIYNFNLIYHSTLFSRKDWKYRFFAEADFSFGFNRLNGEQIFLSTSSGLRGIEKLTLGGTRRAVLNLETRIFSPFSILGFVLGGNLFTDFGMITSRNENLFRSRFYQAYGIGIRTKNESIVTAKFDISLVFNPFNPGNNGARFTVLFSGSVALGFRNFGFTKPSVEDFGNN